ncbi:MAG: hypothetical protein RLZZ393_1201 [Pseudomonadota bacterium]|jgi:diguanylate cyclase (GGDEF)-like protein
MARSGGIVDQSDVSKRSVRGASIEELLDTQRHVLALISRNAPLKESLAAIARFSESWIPGMKGSILRWEPESGRLREGGYGSLPPSFADTVDGLVPGPKAGSCGTCAYVKERVISRDVFDDPLWEDFHGLCREYDIRSAWSSPLLASRDGGLLGVFGMYHPEVRPMTADDEALVDHFARLAAMAIERHRDDAAQEYRATHDVLTGLGNRRLLNEHAPAWLDAARASGSSLSVAFLDLDDFKAINDTFGHVLGDKLLQDVSLRMREYAGDDALIARFGGDEFVIVLRESVDQALERLEQLRRALALNLQLGSIAVQVRYSAGVVDALAEDAGTEFDEIVGQADEMARKAKSDGGDRSAVADVSASRRWRMRNVIARGMVSALQAQDDAIVPYFQPIVSLPDVRVQGFEMLLRLGEPSLADIPISECIAVAEHTGQIHDIGRRMLSRAFQTLSDDDGPFGGLYLNVNVSVRQLMSRQFLDDVKALVAAHPQVVPRICLEVTESQWLDPNGPAGDLLRDLKALGLALALDDFGTGHASLSYLQSLPFDTVKIDRHFVSQVESDARHRSICVALLAMARSCGMTAVAEGVETASQAALLAELGYDRAQGYLWSRPLPMAAAIDWLAEHR